VANEEHGGGEVEVLGWEPGVFLVVVPHLDDEAGVFWGGNLAPLIEKVEDAELVEINELQHCHVIFVGYGFEHMREPLRLEEFLFLLENLGEVDLMQPLIGIIDEQLFQRVAVQDLKPIDVQKAQGEQFLGPVMGGDRVDLIDDPLKQPLVQYLGHGVDEFLHLAGVEVLGEHIAADFDLVAAQRTSQLGSVDLQQFADLAEHPIVGDAADVFLLALVELQVAQQQDAGQYSAYEVKCVGFLQGGQTELHLLE